MVIKSCDVVNEGTSILIIGVQKCLMGLVSIPLALLFELFKQGLHKPFYVLSSHGLKYILILYQLIRDDRSSFFLVVIS
jgi:hypothetical protein